MFPSYRSLPHLECSRSLNLPSARVADHNAAGEARTQWAERSTLYLRNATADAIQDLPDAGGPKCQTAGPDGGPPGQLVRELARQAIPVCSRAGFVTAMLTGRDRVARLTQPHAAATALCQ